MSKVIRIGTRDSELALWQAKTVQTLLEELEYHTVLVPIKSQGDIILDKPLYEMGVTGIFTKVLDVALLKGQIDIAVHSMKDVPTQLPKGIVQGAVLERAISNDVLVHKGTEFLDGGHGTIATGSLRRKAQWLHRYPNHAVIDLRGNVNTRLLKLIQNDWNGAIFAQAGLERVKLLPKDALILDWMLPAPAQGAMMVVALEQNPYCVDALGQLNHGHTQLTTYVEREFLRYLEGGCTAPIGALAVIKEGTVHFKGCLYSLDGQHKITVEKNTPLEKINGFGGLCAQEILGSGGTALMKQIKNEIGSLH
ncbi:MAG: hydroxymethylbilane synthase [Bacteroidota bacterium]